MSWTYEMPYILDNIYMKLPVYEMTYIEMTYTINDMYMRGPIYEMTYI